MVNVNSIGVPTPVHRSPLNPNSDNSAAGDPTIMDENSDTLNNLLVDEEGYWREVKAIIGGVLGFWGGVGGLGTMFLVVVLSQR